MPEETAKTQEAAEKTFTQADVDRIVQERIARVKHEPPADYEELQRKAAEYDKAQEAAKSELDKALERATRAEEELKARQEADKRAAAIKEAATEFGVDEAMLSRMAGDVSENAKFLKEREEAQPKYPNVIDEGESKKESASTADLFGQALKEALS